MSFIGFKDNVSFIGFRDNVSLIGFRDNVSFIGFRSNMSFVEFRVNNSLLGCIEVTGGLFPNHYQTAHVCPSLHFHYIKDWGARWRSG